MHNVRFCKWCLKILCWPSIQAILLVTKSNDNHFDSEVDYGTGCRNVSHCEQQQFRTVHPDNHTQPTYEKTAGFKPFTVMIMMEYSENLPLCSNF